MIPLYNPVLNQRGEEYLLDAYRSGYLSGHGPYVGRFENAFADYLGVHYAVAVSSGTAALETALYAVGVGQGDEVILPSFTIISNAVVVLRLGATPVLVDVTRDHWTLDVEQAEAAVTDRTAAVMPVDMYGRMSGFPDVSMPIVLDACQSLGYKDLYCNKTTCFSFYPNKLITTGEGGMVVTNDYDIYDRARQYRNLCFGHPNKFEHTDIGMNFRMSNLLAAVGLAQLEDIDDVYAKKQHVHRLYRNRLAGVDGIEWQDGASAHWMVAILTRLPSTVVRKKLGEIGIETREFFKGLHGQECLNDGYGWPMWKKYKGVRRMVDGHLPVDEDYPVSDHLYNYGLYLPSSPDLTERQVDYICDTLKGILGA